MTTSDKRYIHDHTITDKYLAPALVSLGSLEDETAETGARRIDYRDLSVRHLGSIYEGLLEYKLFIARERRVRRADGKGGYTFPKLSETRLKKGEEENVIAVGDVYFANSAGERKAMGAYYTPEYIVDYIVKQTVLRGLQERRAALEAQLPGWIADVEAAPPGDRARLQAVVDQKLVDFVEQEVLTFRVCDPAMGSGHFLVNTVHAMTNFIVETLNLTPWENPEIDCDPVRWRRWVAKRCLYGVDLNALAVELAKLSLWLTTVAQGKPLSFLDHHLRHGNSLIGARLEDLIEMLSSETGKDPASENGQLSMFDAYPAFRVPLMEALDLMRDISARLADAAEDVEAQAADYEQLRRELKPYRDLADLLTARHFGVEVDEAQVRAIAHRLLDAELQPSDEDRALLHRAHEVAQDRHFFHWDLEFPEVFIGQDRVVSKTGFDVVVGNPPYERTTVFFETQGYLNELYESAYGSYDIYVLFIERSLGLLHSRGQLGYVVSNKFLVADYGERLRDLLHENHCIRQLVDLSECPSSFPKVLVSPVIIIVEKDDQIEQNQTLVAVLQEDNLALLSKIPLNEEKIDTKIPGIVVDVRKQEYLLDELTGHFNIYLVGSNREIVDKLYRIADPLSQVAYVRTGIMGFQYWSMEPIIMEGHKTDDVNRRLLPPSLIERYQNLWGRKTVRLYKQEMENPIITYDPELIDDNTWNLFMNPKIVVRGVAAKLTATYDASGHGLLVAMHAVQPSAKRLSVHFLIALLNSKLFNWFHLIKYYSARIPEGSLRYPISFLKTLPIRHINFTTVPNARTRLLDMGMVETVKWVESIEGSMVKSAAFRDSGIADWSNARLSTKPAQTDVIHDLLAHLAKQMIELHKQRQRLERKVDLFHHTDGEEPFVRLIDAFVIDESYLADDGMDLEKVHHDIDGLRLTPNEDGTWALDLQAKFRDPEQGWQEWIKEEDGYMIKRRWVPAYRLKMSEEKARFYHYALPRLQDFDNARSFPGGYTRSTLKKLHLTQVPMMPDVDLSELARLDRELTETKRKIRLTDDLIDQIVYKLYGLTEEEIAIVEGRA